MIISNVWYRVCLTDIENVELVNLYVSDMVYGYRTRIIVSNVSDVRAKFTKALILDETNGSTFTE